MMNTVVGQKCLVPRRREDSNWKHATMCDTVQCSERSKAIDLQVVDERVERRAQENCWDGEKLRWDSNE